MKKHIQHSLLMFLLLGIVISFSACEDNPVNDPDPLVLKADFAFSINGMDVNFTSTSTGQIISYNWDFNDQFDPDATASTSKAAHTYFTDGDYEVTLTVSDGLETKTVTKTVTIVFPPEILIARHWLIAEATGNGNPDPGTTGKDLNMFKNGTYSFNGSFTGTWTFNASKTMVYIDKGTGNQQDWNIVELNKQRFTVEFISIFDGSTLVWKMTPK